MESSLLNHLKIDNFTTQSGVLYTDFPLSYQVFGQKLHTAPVILVNHALTGNSNVAGEKGWWKTLVGYGSVIDLQKYTVVCFNVAGNGYDGFFIDNYKNFTAKDMARLFVLGLENLGIKELYALVGGSVGGSIAWEMLCDAPYLAKIFIPVATDYKTTDWLHSQCLVQEFLLESEDRPLEKARIHAMLNYRTPESLNQRFKREQDEQKNILKSHDWLNYHGTALDNRFDIKAYRLMNQLLKTIDAKEEDLLKINSEIHLIGVDSDLHYPAFEIKNSYDFLKNNGKNVYHHEIKSIHGHDAFLMEYEQLNEILGKII